MGAGTPTSPRGCSPLAPSRSHWPAEPRAPTISDGRAPQPVPTEVEVTRGVTKRIVLFSRRRRPDPQLSRVTYISMFHALGVNRSSQDVSPGQCRIVHEWGGPRPFVVQAMARVSGSTRMSSVAGQWGWRPWDRSLNRSRAREARSASLAKCPRGPRIVSPSTCGSARGSLSGVEASGACSSIILPGTGGISPTSRAQRPSSRDVGYRQRVPSSKIFLWLKSEMDSVVPSTPCWLRSDGALLLYPVQRGTPRIHNTTLGGVRQMLISSRSRKVELLELPVMVRTSFVYP